MADLREQIKEDPYNFILNWIEKILPHTGKKAFKIIALMPPSLILPDIPYKSQKIRSNINLLLLTSPGGGKSSIAKKLKFLTYAPVDVRSITPAKLESKIQSNPLFTLIVEDFATMSKDPICVKIIEGILGEEKRVQRSTMRKDVDTETEGIGLICGVPTDLGEYLTGGLIFRLCSIIIFHSIEEHSNIGKKIINGIGTEEQIDEEEIAIKEYYEELLKIQTGDEPITGYFIEDRFKKEIYETWDKLTKQIYKNTKAPLNWFRTLHESFRCLIAHAFLNVHNRKVEDGILYPNEDDFKVALNLMKSDLKIKYKMISMDNFIKNITSLKELSEIINSGEMTEEQKRITESLLKVKRGKIVR